MTDYNISGLLTQLVSDQASTRTNAITKVIDKEIKDELIIIALENVVENDPSLDIRNLARSALDTLGMDYSATKASDQMRTKVIAIIIIIIVAVIACPLLFPGLFLDLFMR